MPGVFSATGDRVLDPRELLLSNLDVVERAVAFACRRWRIDADDAEDLASAVHLKLIDNDYAVLRTFGHRCAFSTFIGIVVQRVILDWRIHEWGKWHPSAEAKRLGPLALELEQLVRRDGRTPEEALTILAPRHEGLTRDSMRSLLERLPERAPRQRTVALDEADSMTGSCGEGVDEAVLAGERRDVSRKLSAAMSAAIEALPDEDRLILQLRFEGVMTVADIARSMQLDQKVLYRRIERCTQELRSRLLRAGVAWRDVRDLIGRNDTVLEFTLRKQEARPSRGSDDATSATHSEGSS